MPLRLSQMTLCKHAWHCIIQENLSVVSESAVRDPYRPDSMTPSDTGRLSVCMVHIREPDAPLLVAGDCAAIRSPRALKSRPRCSGGEISTCGGMSRLLGNNSTCSQSLASRVKVSGLGLHIRTSDASQLEGKAQPSSKVMQDGLDSVKKHRVSLIRECRSSQDWPSRMAAFETLLHENLNLFSQSAQSLTPLNTGIFADLGLEGAPQLLRMRACSKVLAQAIWGV